MAALNCRPVGPPQTLSGIEADHYRLLNDCGEPVLFDPERFDIIDVVEPSFWVSDFGDDGERYAYPPAWRTPGYFEDWHDSVGVVRQMFEGELAVWYPLTGHKCRTSWST